MNNNNNNNNKGKYIFYFFIFLIFLELGLQTFWLHSLNNYLRPIIYFGLAIAYLTAGYYFSILDNQANLINFKIRFNKPIFNFLSLAVIFYLMYFIWSEFIYLVELHKIDPLNSDVIPSVELYVKRFVTGEKVYTPLHFPGWDVAPTYLTLMWFPYVIPEIFGLDYRIFSLILFFIFILIYSIYLLKKQSNNIAIYILAILALGILYLLVIKDNLIFVRTLELTIAVFYMVLALTILNKKAWIISLGILLCLLSRYSLSFWLISYVLVLLVYRNWKFFFSVNFYVFIGVFILFIPFIAHDLNIFVEGLKYYSKAAIGEWKVHSWQAKGEDPFQLSQGFGFAIYFYKFLPGEVVEKLKTLQRTHLIISFISGISIVIIYYFKRTKIKSVKLFLMFGLKFFLMVFFVFIQVPYSYLFIVPLFLIIPLLGQLINDNKLQIVI